MTVAIDVFANTLSGYLTPSLLVIICGMLAYMGRSYGKKVDDIVEELDKTNVELGKTNVTVASIGTRVADLGVETTSNSSGIAKLTESTIQLNTVVAEHIKWSDRESIRLDRAIQRRDGNNG